MRLLVDAPAAVRGIAVVLHGGRETSTAPVRAVQLAVLRMRPFASSLRRAGHSDGLAVAQVRYGVRGWNGSSRAPVTDVIAALDELTGRYPGAPVALVGHSMGGRAALYAAAHASVRAVVGLAPWIGQRDPVRTLVGRRILLVHGDRDRITDPRATAVYARAAEPYAEMVAFVRVAGDNHAMLRRPALWHHLATGFVRSVLFDRHPAADATNDAGRVLLGALAGQAALDV